MRQTNAYHFVDLDVSLPDKTTRTIAAKAVDLADARALHRLQAVADEAKATTTDRDRLAALREKHELPAGTLVRAVRGTRLRRQHDDEDVNLGKPLPASMTGEVTRRLHVVIEYPDGRVTIEPPAITAAAARRRIAEARAAGAKAKAVLRVWTDETLVL